MIHPPAVTVHGLAHACVALAPALPVTLLSARGAALYAGCAWWHNMVSEARRRHPDVAVTDILDCADGAGRAMAALRIGQRFLILDKCQAWDDVAEAARSVGAILLDTRPPSLDLANPLPPARLCAWLVRPPGQPSTQDR
jgi:hypothetical protein